MSAAIKITCMDYSAVELRAVAAKCSDGDQARRLLAIAMILDGALTARCRASDGHGPSDPARLGTSLQ